MAEVLPTGVADILLGGYENPYGDAGLTAQINNIQLPPGFDLHLATTKLRQTRSAIRAVLFGVGGPMLALFLMRVPVAHVVVVASLAVTIGFGVAAQALHSYARLAISLAEAGTLRPWRPLAPAELTTLQAMIARFWLDQSQGSVAAAITADPTRSTDVDPNF